MVKKTSINIIELVAFVSSFKINKAGHVERFIGVTSQMED